MVNYNVKQCPWLTTMWNQKKKFFWELLKYPRLLKIKPDKKKTPKSKLQQNLFRILQTTSGIMPFIFKKNKIQTQAQQQQTLSKHYSVAP